MIILYTSLFFVCLFLLIFGFWITRPRKKKVEEPEVTKSFPLPMNPDRQRIRYCIVVRFVRGYMAYRVETTCPPEEFILSMNSDAGDKLPVRRILTCSISPTFCTMLYECTSPKYIYRDGTIFNKDMY